MATKPTKQLDWATDADPAKIDEPIAAKRELGYVANERPTFKSHNWIFHITDQWIKYLEETTDTNTSIYTVIVGSGDDATHATLQDAVNDGTLGTNQWVLIQEDQTINTAISLTKAGWRIHCRPGVVFTRGAASNGISIEAASVEIIDGRFVGYTTGGDKAITMTVAAEYCKVVGSRFAASTDTEVDDSLVPAGKKPVISQTISEV